MTLSMLFTKHYIDNQVLGAGRRIGGKGTCRRIGGKGTLVGVLGGRALEGLNMENVKRCISNCKGYECDALVKKFV